MYKLYTARERERERVNKHFHQTIKNKNKSKTHFHHHSKQMEHFKQSLIFSNKVDILVCLNKSYNFVLDH